MGPWETLMLQEWLRRASKVYGSERSLEGQGFKDTVIVIAFIVLALTDSGIDFMYS